LKTIEDENIDRVAHWIFFYPTDGILLLEQFHVRAVCALANQHLTRNYGFTIQIHKEEVYCEQFVKKNQHGHMISFEC
jgi:hypothetical protein